MISPEPAGPTYREVGASLAPQLPPGYRHVEVCSPLGPVHIERATEAVLTFAMHRAVGLRVAVSAPRAVPGVWVQGGIGPFADREPCVVVAVVDEPDRAGFAFGTLPGHLLRGEESYVVRRGATDEPELLVRQFSAPARWPARLTAPLAPPLQAAFARRLGRELRRLSGGR